MSAPLISVIIPVYNVEDFLQECIDSVAAQSFANFEVILVNDGSQDNCGIICNENAERDSRIRVIHQQNQGVTRARANGVAAARGEFITFVDSDDTLPPNALEILMAPVNDDTDITIGKYAGAPCPPAGELPLAEYQKKCANMQGIHVGPYARLFRHHLFDKEIFNLPPELRVGEDAVMNIRLAYKATGKVYSTDSVVYTYRENPASAMHTHINTPESDVMLQKYRLASIPPEEVTRLLPQGLADSLICYWINAIQETIALPESTKQHHQFILSIEKHSSLKLALYPYIIMHCRNSFIRYIVINAHKLLKRAVKKYA